MCACFQLHKFSPTSIHFLLGMVEVRADNKLRLSKLQIPLICVMKEKNTILQGKCGAENCITLLQMRLDLIENYRHNNCFLFDK